MLEAPATSRERRPLQVYALYSDSDAAHRDALVRNLAPLTRAGFAEYSDRSHCPFGQPQGAWCETKRDKADVIVVLASADSLASDEILNDLNTVLSGGRIVVIPIVVRAVDLALSPLAKLPALPTDTQSVAESLNADRTWVLIVDKLKRVLLHRALTAQQELPPLLVSRLLVSLLGPYLRWLVVAAGLLSLLGVFALGDAALSARVELLGVAPENFAESALHTLTVGAAVLPGLLLRVALILGGAGHERSLALLPIALLLVPMVLGRRPGARLVALVIGLGVAAVGALALCSVVRLHHVGLDPAGAAAVSHPLGQSTLGDAAFEVASWMKNGGAFNDRRREALAGLYGLSLLAVIGLIGLSMQWPGPARWERTLGRCATAGFALVAVLLLTQAPRAYAIARWGLLYRTVEELNRTCEPMLADALARNACVVWDISEGAKPEIVLLRGAGCPGVAAGQMGARVLSRPELGISCILRRGEAEPVLSRG